MTEKKCYGLYFENQDLTHSPKASISIYIHAFISLSQKMSQAAASKKTVLCKKKREGTAKSKYGKTTMHLKKQFLRSS